MIEPATISVPLSPGGYYLPDSDPPEPTPGGFLILARGKLQYMELQEIPGDQPDPPGSVDWSEVLGWAALD